MPLRTSCRAAALGAALLALALAWPAASTAAGSGGICANCEQESEPGDGGDRVLSLRQLRALSREVGFAKPRVAAAIAMAESGGRVRARARNRKPPPSTDRGLFQINDHWHREVSDRCAYRARCNARAAYRISRRGRDWHQWTVWRSGAYRRYLR